MIRLGEGWGGFTRRLFGLASWLVAAALLTSQLIIDARYINSLVAIGGSGAWSDAIYDLARFAESQPDKTFYLMDWGFSNQLLLLTHGKIHKEEAFVPVKDAPEERRLAQLEPYLRRPNALLVFHAPSFESAPLLKFFEQSAPRLGLSANLVKSFYQRDGTPVYRVYEVFHPRLASYVRGGDHSIFAKRRTGRVVPAAGLISSRVLRAANTPM